MPKSLHRPLLSTEVERFLKVSQVFHFTKQFISRKTRNPPHMGGIKNQACFRLQK